jgi:hypothetical protein
VLTDCRRALFDEEKLGPRQLGLQIGDEHHAMESIKKDSDDQKTSISDAETDDEGMATWDVHGSNVRGHSQLDDDSKLKELVKDMLSILIPAYGMGVRKTSP